tara:strand:- start:8066 stop:9709 length:1644 start_codon:yes stop_codon:yes gene_type:complete
MQKLQKLQNTINGITNPNLDCIKLKEQYDFINSEVESILNSIDNHENIDEDQYSKLDQEYKSLLGLLNSIEILEPKINNLTQEINQISSNIETKKINILRIIYQIEESLYNLLLDKYEYFVFEDEDNITQSLIEDFLSHINQYINLNKKFEYIQKRIPQLQKKINQFEKAEIRYKSLKEDLNNIINSITDTPQINSLGEEYEINFQEMISKIIEEQNKKQSLKSSKDIISNKIKPENNLNHKLRKNLKFTFIKCILVSLTGLAYLYSNQYFNNSQKDKSPEITKQGGNIQEKEILHTITKFFPGNPRDYSLVDMGNTTTNQEQVDLNRKLYSIFIVNEGYVNVPCTKVDMSKVKTTTQIGLIPGVTTATEGICNEINSSAKIVYIDNQNNKRISPRVCILEDNGNVKKETFFESYTNPLYDDYDYKMIRKTPEGNLVADSIPLKETILSSANNVDEKSVIIKSSNSNFINVVRSMSSPKDMMDIPEFQKILELIFKKEDEYKVYIANLPYNPDNYLLTGNYKKGSITTLTFRFINNNTLILTASKTI